mmetsp:Transcript_17804/g.21283  ORF Transcript_17804/g.21283 Transcript_17804/m.21283 type:complete len:136 (-) Transcript_17804:271-678(-)
MALSISPLTPPPSNPNLSHSKPTTFAPDPLRKQPVRGLIPAKITRLLHHRTSALSPSSRLLQSANDSPQSHQSHSDNHSPANPLSQISPTKPLPPPHSPHSCATTFMTRSRRYQRGRARTKTKTRCDSNISLDPP